MIIVRKRKQGKHKASYVLDAVGKGIRKAWTTGQRVTVDESMIKYMVRAVPYMIQYMPAKPIKREIKVYCVCCAVRGIILSFQIYTGKKTKKPHVPASIDLCTKLCRDAGLLEARGRVLYTY